MTRQVSPLTPPLITAHNIENAVGWRPKKLIPRPARLDTGSPGEQEEEDADEEERTPLTPNPTGPGGIGGDRRSPYYHPPLIMLLASEAIVAARAALG